MVVSTCKSPCEIEDRKESKVKINRLRRKSKTRYQESHR